MPPPPGTFSTMMGWPNVSPSAGCRMRASESIGPPAANGTTMVSGRLGQSWAAAGETNSSAASSAMGRNRISGLPAGHGKAIGVRYTIHRSAGFNAANRRGNVMAATNSEQVVRECAFDIIKLAEQHKGDNPGLIKALEAPLKRIVAQPD